MLTTRRHYITRRRFQKLIAHFDRQIEEARAKHLPVREIERAKSQFVHECLRGDRA